MHKKRVALALLLAGVLAGTFALGLSAGDDSAEVARLDAATVRLTRERDKETTRAADLATQLEDQDERIDELEDKAEEAPAATEDEEEAEPTPTAQRKLGSPAKVGELTITPISFVRASGSGEAGAFNATISVKNNGSDDISPFCGDSGAELVDAKGRSFDPEGVIDESSSVCEDIQPGLTSTNLKLRFDVPAEARPRALRLWGESGNEALTQTWTVKGVE